MLFKLSNLNSNLTLTLGYLNPALNNSAQLVIIKKFPAAGPIEYESDPSSDIDKNYFSDQESLTG